MTSDEKKTFPKSRSTPISKQPNSHRRSTKTKYVDGENVLEDSYSRKMKLARSLNELIDYKKRMLLRMD